MEGGFLVVFLGLDWPTPGNFSANALGNISTSSTRFTWRQNGKSKLYTVKWDLISEDDMAVLLTILIVLS